MEEQYQKTGKMRNKKSARRDSNPRPRPWQGRAPPTEPLAHVCVVLCNQNTRYSIERARDGTRTRGPDLGKVVLHQLSHSRTCVVLCNRNTGYSIERARDGTRTRGPDLGKVVLHQLSHSRILCCTIVYQTRLIGYYRIKYLSTVF